MIILSYRTKVIIGLAGGLLLMILFFGFLDNKDRTLLNFFGIIGTFLSVYGIWIAYEQIKSTKATTEQTNRAVVNSLSRIIQLFSVADLSRAIKIIHEIQNFILSEKYELALLRMKDLKATLIQVKYNKELLSLTNIEIYNKAITDLSIDTNNINDLLLGKKKVNFSKVNENLNQIETILGEFENKLKFENYGS
jgi:hypothetical protein